jgi:O-antigen ligase
MPDTADNSHAGSISLDFIPTKLTKQNLVLFLIIALVVGILSARFPMIAAVSVLLALALPLTLFFPYEVFLILSFLLLSLGDYFGSKPILLGGFKFYGADYFLLILIIVAIRISKTDREKTKSPLTLLLWVYIIYGFVSLLIGLFYQNHELNRTIGDFRRFFYYPIAFFLGWMIVSEKKDIFKFEKIISFVPVIILAFASMRLATGQTWAPEIHARPEDFRAMPYFDGIALIFLFSYFMALFFAKRRLNLLQLSLTFLIPIFIVLSGFRLLWVLFILSIMLVFWFTIKQKGKRKYIRILLYLILIVLISMILFRVTGGRYFEMFETKIVNKILRYEHSSERWRYPAWKSALNKFESSPIVGTGLGDEPIFWAMNSADQWQKITRTLHNAFLEILYQTGIIGALLFVLILVKYSVFVYKNIPSIDNDFMPIIIALFVLFVCGTIQSLFQPYLNHPGNGVIFFAFMGVAMKATHLSRLKIQNL